MEHPRRYPATQSRRITLRIKKCGTEKTREVTFPALPPRIRKGDTFGEFRIEREIALGATAAVYEAFQSTRERKVALKVLSPHLALVPEAAARFKAEAAFAESVESRYVVSIYGSGKERDHYYYAMKLHSGRTAEHLHVEAAGTEDDAYYQQVARLFAAVARALDACHAQGIVHRDVKPENLLIGPEGELIICDFGSALDAQNRWPLFERALWGTARYMPPEQFSSGANPYDPSIDIYALGVSLYEVATGVSPFPRCSEEELRRLKLTRLPPAARRVNFRVPLGLDAVIRQAIDPNRSLRHSSAANLADDLERFSERKRGHRR